MSDLRDWEITFRKNPIFGMWGWVAIGPDGDKLTGPQLGAMFSREAAERDALRRIRIYLETETVDGETLAERVESRG